MDVVTLGQARADAAKRYGAFIRPRGDFIMLGDSLTSNTGLYTESPQFYQDSLPSHIAAQSGGVLRLIRNAGVSGNTTAQMLARFDTDVAPYKPGTVLVMGGTNDLGGTFNLATTTGNLKAIVAKTRAIGAVPVLCTIPPNTYNGNVGRGNVYALNAWIRRYCQTSGILCLDVFKYLIDPATGGFLSQYSAGDSVHFNVTAQVYLGAQLAPILTKFVAGSSSPTLTYENADLTNLITGGLFTTAATSGIAGGWANYGGANTSGNTASVTTDAQVAGNMQTITAASATGGANIGQNIVNSKLIPGNRLAFSGIITTTGPMNYAQVKITFNGASVSATWRTTQVVTREVFYLETVVPAGTTSADVFITSSTGTGSVSVGQATLYDLTALGAA